jgi:hypothetical protein
MRPSQFFVALLVVGVLAGCKEIKRVEQASHATAQNHFNNDSLSSVPAPAVHAPTSPAVRIYLDASQSMMGYVGCRTRATEFDQTLDRLANDLGTGLVTLFGSAPGNSRASFVERPLDHAVHCPQAYGFAHNPDDQLFQRFAADTTGQAFVYISDGVQSSLNAATPSPSVAALQQWIASGNALAILAFRSEYAGRLWSEQLGQWVAGVDTDRRPFYMLFFARSEPEMNDILNRISPALKAKAKTLRFRTEGVRCDFQRTASIYTEDASVNWFFLDPSAYQDYTDDPQQIGSYTCVIPADHPLGEVGAQITATYRRWNGKGFDPATPATGADFDGQRIVTNEHNGSSAAILASFPSNTPTARFGLYEIGLSPVQLTLSPDIDALTTETDSTPESADQTYRFGWMVEHLVRSQFSSMISPTTTLITVQHKK